MPTSLSSIGFLAHLIEETPMSPWRWEPSTLTLHSLWAMALVSFVVVVEVETSLVAEEHESDGPGADLRRSCMYASVKWGYVAIAARRRCGDLMVGNDMATNATIRTPIPTCTTNRSDLGFACEIFWLVLLLIESSKSCLYVHPFNSFASPKSLVASY